jgi:hypothetical protein
MRSGRFVEVLDRYFQNVCELDLIFNFHKAYYILDELLVAGGRFLSLDIVCSFLCFRHSKEMQ